MNRPDLVGGASDPGDDQIVLARRGILSSAPSLGSIRVLLGSHVLLLIQAGLVLRCQPPLSDALSPALHAVAIIGIASLLLAIIGEPGNSAERRPPARLDRAEERARD